MNTHLVLFTKPRSIMKQLFKISMPENRIVDGFFTLTFSVTFYIKIFLYFSDPSASCASNITIVFACTKNLKHSSRKWRFFSNTSMHGIEVYV